MKKILAFLFAALMLVPSVVHAESVPSPAPSPYSDLQLSSSHDTVSNGFGDWWTTDLWFVRQDGNPGDNKHTVYANVEDTNRFSKHDVQLLVGSYFPLAGSLSATVEGRVSTAQVLPSYNVFGELSYGSGQGWFEKLGAYHREYSANSVNAGEFTLERYWGRFRASYTFTAAQLNGQGTDVLHSAGFDYYYGPYGSVAGIRYQAGTDIENVGAPALLVSAVDGWTFVGQHFFDPHWAFAYQLERYVQGTTYTRTGVGLGLRYRY